MFAPPTSFRIRKDTRREDLRADQAFTLPITGTASLPSFNIQETIGGGLLYNNITKLVYYNDGTQWLPLTGGTGSNIKTYCLIKDLDLNVLTDTDTILTSWDASPLPYHDQTGTWNLSTGVYTAGMAQSLMVAANITWAADASTIGRRYLQIIYKPSAGSPTVAKEAVTQPDPDVEIKSTQEATITLRLATGDQVWVQVRQTSGMTIPISGGNETSLSGIQAY